MEVEEEEEEDHEHDECRLHQIPSLVGLEPHNHPWSLDSPLELSGVGQAEVLHG